MVIIDSISSCFKIWYIAELAAKCSLDLRCKDFLILIRINFDQIRNKITNFKPDCTRYKVQVKSLVPSILILVLIICKQ